MGEGVQVGGTQRPAQDTRHSVNKKMHPGGRWGFTFSTEEKEAPEISEGSGRVFPYTVSSLRAELALDSFISATSLVQSTGPGLYFKNAFNTCERMDGGMSRGHRCSTDMQYEVLILMNNEQVVKREREVRVSRATGTI